MMTNARSYSQKARRILLGFFIAMGLSLALGASATLAKEEPPVDIGGPFTLVDQNGKTVTDADFHGKYLLVYFGYTFCPDMCPTGLQSISGALDKLGKDAAKVQSLFITVDPERDTPAKLKDYVASFHPNILGLTGSPEQIAAVAKAYKVYYKKAEEVDDGQYMMDHSTGIYMMDGEGHYLQSFEENENPNKIASALRKTWGKTGVKKP